MRGRRLGILTRAGLGLALGAAAVAVSVSEQPAGAQSFPTSTDVETYRDTIKTGSRPARVSTVVLPPDRVNPRGTGMRTEDHE